MSSGSGLSRSLDLATLSTSQDRSGGRCNFIAGFADKTATCSDGSTASFGGVSAQSCESALAQVTSDCTATVGNAEGLRRGGRRHPCNGPTSAACQALFACISDAL